jgi:transposase
MARCIGLDVHRDFAQVAIWEKGRVVDAGRVSTSPEGLRTFTKTLRKDRSGGARSDGEHRGDRRVAC